MSGADTNVDYDELRRLVEAALPRFKSARALSMEASGGSNPDLVRNLLTGTNPVFPAVFSLCEAIGVPLAHVIKGIRKEGAPAKDWLTVEGEVEAGIWRDQIEWSPSDMFQVEVDHSDEPGTHHGLMVRGRSMDRIFPEGTILRCIDLINANADWTDGDYVIVERKDRGRAELTCKRLGLGPDGWSLIAESSLPQFREPIFIGKPVMGGSGLDFDGIDDNDTRVRALVIDAYLPLRRRRRRPLPE